MPHSEAYNTIYLLGIILSFIVGFAGVWIGLRNSRKTIYINAITTARIKYIQDLRNSISEFCGLIHTYREEYKKYETDLEISLTDQEKEKAKLVLKELYDMYKRVDNLKYLIRLHLNIEDEYFDKEIIRLTDEIIDKSEEEPKEKINELITIMQFLLKLEWEGAKLESSIGIVSKRKKKLLYKKYEQRHKSYLAKSKNISNNEQK